MLVLKNFLNIRIKIKKNESVETIKSRIYRPKNQDIYYKKAEKSKIKIKKNISVEAIKGRFKRSDLRVIVLIYISLSHQESVFLFVYFHILYNC